MTERSYKINTDVLRARVSGLGGVVKVSKRLGFKKQRFSHWLTGRYNVPESAIVTICRELQIPGDDLLDENLADFVNIVFPRLT